MVTKNMELVKMIVQGKGKECYKTAGAIPPDPLQIVDIPNAEIINNIDPVIKMK
jgi:hypothetical protein